MMSSTVASNEVSLVRLYLLRAMYLVLVIGLGATNLPQIFMHEPTARGVIPSFLAAICVLSLVGIRYPLQMLPLLFFEFVWKAIWLFAYGLPQWHSGQTPATFGEDFPAITAGVILMPIVIPWRYFIRRYIKQPADRWR